MGHDGRPVKSCKSDNRDALKTENGYKKGSQQLAAGPFQAVLLLPG